ncbi:MAG: adenylyl-sulfate kinase [Bacteroidota bacterium]
MSEHIFPVNSLVSSADREKTLKQKAVLIWLTGLSGSGKTTIGRELEKKLNRAGFHAFLLDGDSLRAGLNKDLGFSIEDRNENIRRAGEVCKLLTEAGLIVITTFISPLRSQRDAIRARFKNDCFVEVFIDTPLQICEERDVKGLYKKARAGEVKNFTGIDSPYEPPLKPELTIETKGSTESESADKLESFIMRFIKV